MYVSPCASHYFRQHYERMSAVELAKQRQLLQEGLLAIEEERAEVAALPARAGAKLLGDLEREAANTRAKLAAVEELMAEVAQQGS